MRRILVVFLILLFPLNLLALSCSVASLDAAWTQGAPGDEAGPSAAHAASDPADSSDGDLDPDEPPPGADPHDQLKQGAGLNASCAPDRRAFPPISTRHGRGPLPPIKPPPLG